jgi:phospholipase C
LVLFFRKEHTCLPLEDQQMPLADIETIVFLMMENRSFDHVFGYLATATPPLPINGINPDPAWLAARANTYAEIHAAPHPIALQQIDDPPHDHTSIALQIGIAPSPGEPPPADPTAVMGYYQAASLPAYDFLARAYAVCDHWFAALPAGTQPNRMMAMSGSSPILNNAEVALPNQPLVYDWLTANNVAWCAYQSGDFFPFFSLMPGWLPEIVTSLAYSALGGRGRFRRTTQFAEHWSSAAPMPSVIFIEPEYTDGPHGSPNDDHPPTGVARGQALVADLYTTLISNPARWTNTLLIVTYDEHGGFYDHVPPLPIPSTVAGVPVATTGLRVPALLISPHVKPGTPFSAPLDHTSFLQLLADRFTPGQDYSPDVAARQTALGRISDALTVSPSAAPPTALPEPVLDAIQAQVTAAPASAGTADSPGAARTTAAFHSTAMTVARNHPDLLGQTGWASLANYVASSPGPP